MTLVRPLVVLLCVAGAGAAAFAAADIPNDSASIAHALNRLTFGPRPGQVELVRKEGLGRWIDRQLAGSREPDPVHTNGRPGLVLQTRQDAILQPGQDTALQTPQEMRRAARRAIDDLAAAKLTRAASSDRQLEEVLADFWFNHFNVFAAKGRTAIHLPSYERDAIRPHVLGKFRDLLGATAHHPAMLIYLDNVRSRAGNVNENYARELLELHTLGVDGSYTQQDIVNVARAFTGWTIGRAAGSGPARQSAPRDGAGLARQNAQRDGGFRFARGMHDTEPKTVLGTAIGGRGVDEGERVLDLLAAHPATARHIATKLARRFVSDEPPSALVTRAAKRFQDTGGDLREVVRAIVTSPEFFAPAARNAKVKTPLEFVVSIFRLKADATENQEPGTRNAEARSALRALRDLGMPLYLCRPPTGYDDTADTWITAGALVARTNLAQQLAPQQASIVGAPEFQKK